jgi:hypothetical protein
VPGSSAALSLLADRGGGGEGWCGVTVVCFSFLASRGGGGGEGRSKHGSTVFGSSGPVLFIGLLCLLSPASSGSMAEPGSGAARADTEVFFVFWSSSPVAWGGLFLLPPTGPYGCRAHVLLLRRCAGFYLSRRPKWPSSPAVVWWPVRSDSVGGVVEAKRT